MFKKIIVDGRYAGQEEVFDTPAPVEPAPVEEPVVEEVVEPVKPRSHAKKVK